VDEVALFSGGIDSFAGAANDLVCNNKSLLLVGHSGATKIRSVQDILIKELKERWHQRQVSFVPVCVSNIGARTVEHTQRTRPFLFACLGLVIAQMAEKDRFTFYENGVVSMNPPVSGDIVGGRATRTTHPRVLRGLERLFSLILEREISIDTPLQWMTKPEVVQLIKDAGMSDLLPMTCSCTRTHSRTKAQPHCGECSQCIDRRFAVLAAGMEEYEPASTYRLDLMTADRTGNENLRMALNYVAFFNKLRGVSQNRFLLEYSEFVSALADFRAAKSEVGTIEFITALDLAGRLDISEPALRTLLKRLRRSLDPLATDLGIPLDENSFIENLHGKGYRLNPNLREVALADIKEKGPPPAQS